MFALLLLVCAGLFGSLPFGETTTTGTDSPSTAAVIAKCDNDVLAKINAFQCNAGRPGHMIRTAANNKIEIVLNTTVGYYADNVTCVSSKFIPNEDCSSATVIITFGDKNKSTSQKNITVTEKCGSTYDPDSKIRRVHIWYYKGVSVEYVCSEAESAKTGSPSMLVKCAAQECATETLKDAADVLKQIGHDAPKVYTKCE